MSLKKIVLIFFLFVYFQAYSQKFTISGFVEDAKTGERLIGASVFNASNLSGTTTNVYGFYSLTIPQGKINFSSIFVGYTQFQTDFELSKDTVINIKLSSGIELSEIEVSGKRNEVDDNQMSLIDVPLKTIRKIPAFMGEVDVLKAIQLLPGVQSGTEGTSGIYVRGGGPDQNLILLDGVPIYNANHLFGFFSVFNGDAISDVTLIKGGFPARYGGRLSSVLDIRMKEGNLYQYKTNISIGLIASRVTFEGPIKKGKSSFIISARRSYLDLFVVPGEWIYAKIKKEEMQTLSYYFQDFNVKINQILSKRDRIYFSVYTGIDKAYGGYRYTSGYDGGSETSIEKFTLQWGNLISAARWNHQFSSKLFSNTTATYSKFYNTIKNEEKSDGNYLGIKYNQYYLSQYITEINDYALNTDFDYILNPNVKFKFGASSINHNFNPGMSVQMYNDGDEKIDTAYGSKNIRGIESSVYLETELNFGKYISVNVGGRLSTFYVKDTMFVSPEPRISARFLITKDFSIKLSYSEMQQNVHLLTNSTIGMPTDIWIPATNIVKPEKSTQYASGFAFNILDKLDFTVEGYYKQMYNLVEYKEGQSLFLNFEDTEVSDASDWEKKVTQGKGWAYGVEFLLQKDYGKLNGWIGYTLSWNNRQFDEVSFGRIFPAKYDRRHDISIVLTYKKSEKLDFGLTWVYGTGNNVSLATYQYVTAHNAQSYYNTYNPGSFNYYNGWHYFNLTDYYGKRNNFRMPAYHRLDLGINFNKIKKRGTRTWSISIYNAYSRMNPFYLQTMYDWKTETTKLYSFGLFPIIPTVSYNFKFN